jgi:hypothetical protein
MPNEPNPNANGAAEEQQAPRSLREVAEEAWTEVVDEGEYEGADETPPSGQPRDEFGRFAPRSDTGEQTDEVPAPTESAPPTPAQPTQPPPGSSSEPPQHWSNEDRAMFARLPREGRDFLLRRHGDMERDYQSKAQASASAVNFTTALAPIFDDPVIAKSLNDVGANPYHAISEWAAFHKRALSNDPRERFGLLRDLAVQMNFDPAAVFAGHPSAAQQVQLPAGIPPEVANSPAFRYITDQLNNALSSVTTLESKLTDYQSTGERQRQQEVFERTRADIYSYADEVDQQGRRLRPDFDTVIPQILDLVRANPATSIHDAYETARWMNPTTRSALIAAGHNAQSSAANVRRAQAAVRGNVRGSTTLPVAKPKPETGKRSLRDVIDESAEEVGFNE